MKSILQSEIARVFLVLSTTSLAGLGFNALRNDPIQILSVQKPVRSGPGSLERMSPQELRDSISEGKALLILDVRGASAFSEGHIPGSVSAPEAEFIRSYQELGLDSMMRASDGTVVLCQSADCPAADRIANALRQFGHRPVWVLEGGWVSYQEEVLKELSRDDK